MSDGWQIGIGSASRSTEASSDLPPWVRFLRVMVMVMMVTTMSDGDGDDDDDDDDDDSGDDDSDGA